MISRSNNATPINASVHLPVYCPHCTRQVFNGSVITARCVNVATGLAKCKCKAWVRVPISYAT